MSQEVKDNGNNKDFTKSWVISSKFVLYVSVFSLIAFVMGSCYHLYQKRYMGKPEVEIQSSTKYTPEYK